MTFVEAVTREFLEQIENRVGLFLRNIVGACTTGDEVGTFFRHFLLVFHSHGAPEEISLTEGIASQFAGCGHNLFLVNHDPVGIGADFLQQRMFVTNFGQPFLALDVVADEFHRTRPIKRD